MRQITEIKDLKGKTVSEAFNTDGVQDDYLILKFTDGDFAIFQGGGSYAEDGFCEIASDLGVDFDDSTERDNLRVRLGIRTQEELDLFNDKQRQDREKIRRKNEEARRPDSERFPTLNKLGVIE